MRLFLYFIFFCVFTFQAQTTFSQDHNIYANFGIAISSHFDGELGVNYIYKNKYSFYIGSRNYSERSPDRPSDFKGGLFSVFGAGNGSDLYEDVQILIGRVLPSKNGNSRLNLRAGVSYTNVQKAINFEYNPTFFGPNYSYDRHRFSTVSLIISPVFEITRWQVFGMYLSSVLVINKETVVFGAGLGITAGLLRAKKKKGAY